jgi:hypothetical protein
LSQTAEENLVAVLFLLVVLGIVLLILRRIRGGSAEVDVFEELSLPGAAHERDAALAGALSGMRGARFRALGPGRYVLTVTRSPNWTLWFLPLFGLGFLLSLIFIQTWPLNVTLYDGADGARVRLEGKTEQRVLDRVRAVVTTQR